MNKSFLLICAAALALGGCVSLAPKLPAAQPDVPAAWPLPEHADAAATGATQGRAADIGWRQFYVDPRLATLIEQSLRNNRDLRVAVLNVEKARAQ